METLPVLFEKQQLTPQKEDQKLGDAIERFIGYKSFSLSPKSVKTYTESLNEMIKAFGSDREVTTIDETDMMFWLKSINRKPTGVYMIWQTADFFFRWYYAGDEDKNPLQHVHMKRPKREPIKGIDRQQVDKVLKTIKGSNATRDKAIISVLFASGLRKQEFCALQLQDVNPQTGMINVRKGKGDKFRQVYITGRALLQLRKYLRSVNPEEPALWQTPRGSALTGSGIHEILKRCCIEANLPEIYDFHDFRRGCALQLKRSGADIKDISHFLGHADLKTTEIYLKLDDQDAAATAIRFDPLK